MHLCLERPFCEPCSEAADRMTATLSEPWFACDYCGHDLPVTLFYAQFSNDLEVLSMCRLCANDTGEVSEIGNIF